MERRWDPTSAFLLSVNLDDHRSEGRHHQGAVPVEQIASENAMVFEIHAPSAHNSIAAGFVNTRVSTAS